MVHKVLSHYLVHRCAFIATCTVEVVEITIGMVYIECVTHRWILPVFQVGTARLRYTVCVGSTKNRARICGRWGARCGTDDKDWEESHRTSLGSDIVIYYS
jgi:hypothetical protein